MCRNLEEIVEEIDNPFLDINDILDLEKCVEFISKLEIEEIKKYKTDFEIINIFKNEVEKYKKIELYFSIYVNKYSKNSIFLLTNIKNEFFKGKYYEEEEINNQKKKRETEITIDNLLELGERVRLINKKVSRDDQKNKRFIEIVNEIYNIYGLIQDIYKAGYPEIINIKITIINYESQFSGCGLESKTFLRFFSKLKEILTEIRKNIIKSYLEFPIMRFIYGRLFNLIYNSYTKEKKVYNKISSFLKFMFLFSFFDY